MLSEAVISTAEGGLYRVKVGAQVSAKIPALLSVGRLAIDFDRKSWEKKPPAVGDCVLCWFPGEAYADGIIIGMVEEL